MPPFDLSLFWWGLVMLCVRFALIKAVGNGLALTPASFLLQEERARVYLERLQNCSCGQI